MFCFTHPTEEWTGLLVIFLNSSSSAAALVFDLPLCTHTDTRRETERGQSPEFMYKSSKNTIFLTNTLSDDIRVKKKQVCYTSKIDMFNLSSVQEML